MRKETKNKVLEVLAKMAMASASKEADSACFLFGYQPISIWYLTQLI